MERSGGAAIDGAEDVAVGAARDRRWVEAAAVGAVEALSRVAVVKHVPVPPSRAVASEVDGADVALVEDSPMGRGLEAALRLTAAVPGQVDVFATAPLQALARLHV